MDGSSPKKDKFPSHSVKSVFLYLIQGGKIFYEILWKKYSMKYSLDSYLKIKGDLDSI